MKAILSIIIGIIGLLISSCGLLVIGNSLTYSRGFGIWSVAVPCVLVGGLLLWGAVALWMSWRKSIKPASANSSPDDVPPPN